MKRNSPDKPTMRACAGLLVPPWEYDGSCARVGATNLFCLPTSQCGRRVMKNIGWLRLGTLAIFADSEVCAVGRLSTSLSREAASDCNAISAQKASGWPRFCVHANFASQNTLIKPILRAAVRAYPGLNGAEPGKAAESGGLTRRLGCDLTSL